MKRTFFLSAGVLLLALPAAAQSASGITPGSLPPGKILNATPNFARWTITIVDASHAGPAPAPKTADAGAGAVNGSLDGGPPPPPPRKIVVEKTGKIRHVTGVDVEGATEELWIDGPLEVIISPGQDNPLIYDTHGSIDPYYIRFALNDFPGFEWIAPHNFVGMEKVGDRNYLVFRDEVPPEGPHEEVVGKAEATAYIDADTRLPFKLKRDGRESTYRYDSPPTEMLDLPANVAGAVAARQKYFQNLSRAPARPY